VPYTRNATSSNVLFGAAAVGSTAGAVSTVGLVDEDEGGLLITGRAIRSGSCRNTKCADHCERRLGCWKQLRVRDVRGWGELWGFLEGFYTRAAAISHVRLFLEELMGPNGLS
jgi:hypothetical protein